MTQTPAPHDALHTLMPPVPGKLLLWLAAVVLLVHLALLQGVSLQMGDDGTHITRPFITRTLPPPPIRAPAQRKPPAPKASPPPPPPPLLTDTPAQAEPPAPESVAAPPPTPTAPEPVVPPQEEKTAPVVVPGSLRLKYDIKGEVRSLHYFADGELLWLHDGKTYDARLEVGAFLLGSRVQTSTGRITSEGLAPRRFGDKVRSEVAAHFERDKGKIIFSANTPEAELQPNAQDQLSIFIQLASLIAADPARYPKGASFEMQAVGAREAEVWRFVVEGEELLQLPVGEQRALKLTKLPEKASDLSVTLWLAPALGYLPARIRLTQNNGDFIDQQLSSSALPEAKP